MASSTGAADPERSSLSTSSVDRFLRDHGFDLSGAGGLELSSLSADSDGAEAATAPAGSVSFQSASEDEAPVTPRFTLLDAKDFDLAVPSPNGERNGAVEAGEEEQQSELVLGGSGFSGFSSGATDERSRIAQTLHEEGAVAAASALHQRTLSLAHRDTAGGGSRSSSRSAHSSAASRVLDDELSDALGVTVSTPERPAARDAAASSRPPRSSHRSLFPAQEEDERKESESATTRASLPQPPPRPPALPTASRLRSASPPVVESPRAAASDADDGWIDLNDSLRKHGLQPIAFEKVDARSLRADALGHVTLPDRESIANLVQDVVLQLERKDQIIQDIILESNRNSREQSRAEGSLQTAEKKHEAAQKALESARVEITRLQDALKKSNEAHDEHVKHLKQTSLHLQQQLKVSEHRVKAKEVLVERMQLKLQQQADRESLSKARDQRVFRQLQQRDAKKTSARDSQALEFIGMYEAQREQLQEEIDHLKTQVAALSAELRDKENYIARKASGAATQRAKAAWGDGDSDASDNDDNNGSASSPHATAARRQRRRDRSRPASVVSDDMMLERLEAARREQELAATKLRRREAAMIKRVGEIEHELLAARDAVSELKEENANLALEAESRPSIRDYRLSQRRIHQLERQVAESKLALQEATDLHELRRYMGTKALVERDRLDHRLHLNRLNALPRETTLEVVKEVCRVLNLTDITRISPSLEKLCRVVAAVPRMEKFIRDVCGFVFLSGATPAADGTGADPDADPHFELERVLPTLQHWSSERRRLHALEEFQVTIVSELCKRSVEPGVLSSEAGRGGNGASSQSPSLSRAVHAVAELVDLEKNVLHHREIYSQAATEIERRPSVLVNQIVRHFSHLFHVKSVEGVLPKINEIFLFVNEMENFLNIVRGLLQLKAQASVTACLNAIRDKLEGDEPSLAAENSPPNRLRSRETNFVVEKASPRGGGLSSDIAGVRQVREMTILVRALKRELGAASMHEILPRTKRLMELLSLSIHHCDSSEGEDDD
ncbi:hypothetical protein PybrP1_002662 [[Pythium] brassicae (nom. inval.)]|nr:hypothetical protein PybrP1_002662 [[Pythium] brassicae (nom. inval.)]